MPTHRSTKAPYAWGASSALLECEVQEGVVEAEVGEISRNQIIRGLG